MVRVLKRSTMGKDRKRWLSDVWLTPEEREALAYFDALLDEGDNIAVAIESTRKQFPSVCDQFYGWLER